MTTPHAVRSIFAIVFCLFSFQVFSQSPPVITSFPPSYFVGHTIIIYGDNFSPNAWENIVYFGGVRATVTGASTTEMTVNVPAGARYEPISVTTNGLTTFSNSSFLPLGASSAPFVSNSFEETTLAAPSAIRGIVTGDIDMDGQPDIVSVNSSSFSVFRNLSTMGSLAESVFQRSDFAAPANARRIGLGDVNGDGVLDVVLAGGTGATSTEIWIYESMSSAGSISFSETPVQATSVGKSPRDIVVRDVDMDGNLDIIVGNDIVGGTNGAGGISVFHNTSSAGTTSFGTGVFYQSQRGGFIAVDDLDDDGKTDIVSSPTLARPTLTVFQNTSVPGTIGTSSLTAHSLDVTIYNVAQFGLRLVDLDGDGRDEIVNSYGQLSVFQNNSFPGGLSDASFTVSTISPPTTASGFIDAHDFNNDGLVDIGGSSANGLFFMPNLYAGNGIELAAGVTMPISEGGVNGLVARDMDFDGLVDIVLGRSSGSSISIFRRLMSQTIDFPALGDKTVGVDAPVALPYATSLGNAVTYESSNPEVATILGETLYFKSNGQVTITISSPGDASAAAVSVSQTINVSLPALTITSMTPGHSGYDNFVPGQNFEVTFSEAVNPKLLGDIHLDVDLGGLGEARVESITPSQTNKYAFEDNKLTFRFDFNNYADIGETRPRVNANIVGSPAYINVYPYGPQLQTFSDFTGSAGYNELAPIYYATPTNGCTIVPDVAPGSIAFIDRSESCSIETQVALAVAAGASAVIIKNNQAGPFEQIEIPGQPIPTVGISYEDGETLKFYLQYLGPQVAQVYSKGNTAVADWVLFNSRLSQSIDFPAIESQPYAGQFMPITASPSSGLPVTLISSDHDVAFPIGSNLLIVGAGEAVITARQEGDGGYFPWEEKQTVVITKAQLILTPDKKTKVKGELNPELTFTYSGFVGGEGEGYLDELPSISTTATTNSPVGTYPITVAGGWDNNYYFTYFPGELDVLPDTYLTTPPDGTTGLKPSPKLIAKSVTGASSYTIELAAWDPGFNSITQSKSGSATQTFDLEYSTTYYARVKTNQSPLYGKTTSFTTAGPEYYAYAIAPANNATEVNPSSVGVISNVVPLATYYYFEVNSDPNFFPGTAVLREGERSQTFSGLAYNTTYYIRVRTELSGEWGASRSFTTKSAAAQAYMTSPADGATNQATALSISSGMVSGATNYTIQLSETQDFVQVDFESTGTSRMLPFTGLKFNQRYYSRVRTNLSAEFGPVKSFTTQTAEAITYVMSPSNGATNINNALKVVSNAVPGATLYTIQLSETSGFTNVAFEVSGSSNSLSFATLKYNTTYYNRVKTNLSADYGQVRSFTTKSMVSLATVTSPTMGATAVNPSVKIKLNDVAGAAFYIVEVNTAADFTGASITQQNASTTIPFELGFNQQYFVRARTSLNDDWTATQSFTTSNPTALAYVVSPFNGTTGQPTTLTVATTSITGATSYTVELNTAPDFTGTAIVKTSTTRSVRFMRLAESTTYYTRVKTSLDPLTWGGVFTSFTTAAASSGREASDVAAEELDAQAPFQVQIYPNPFRERLTIMVQTPTPENATITLLDMQGREHHHSQGQTNARVEIAKPELASGQYLLRVNTTRGQEVIRIVKME